MTNELIGALNGAAADGIAATAALAVIDAIFVVGEITYQIVAVFLGFR